MNALIAYAIAALLILLGFAALLSQKIYVDSSTRTVTSVELPILGKLQTNYPALVFVFLGCSLSFAVFKVSFDVKREWTLTGSLKLPPDKHTKIDWKKTLVTITPSDEWADPVTAEGRYTIHAILPDGTPVEKAIDRLDFTNPIASAYILVGKERDRYSSDRGQSLVENISGRTWTLKPTQVEVYEQPEAPE
jgi:hypothetical protein